jgi:hypothetical protein
LSHLFRPVLLLLPVYNWGSHSDVWAAHCCQHFVATRRPTDRIILLTRCCCHQPILKKFLSLRIIAYTNIPWKHVRPAQWRWVKTGTRWFIK